MSGEGVLAMGRGLGDGGNHYAVGVAMGAVVAVASARAGRSLRADLAHWRAGRALDDAACLVLFGVCGDTLQRIEAGDVDPEPELAERIGRVIAARAALGAMPPFSGDPSISCGPAVAAAGDGRRAVGDGSMAEPLPRPAPPGFALQIVGERRWLAMALDGEVRRYSIAEARAMRAEIGELLDFLDDPRRLDA